MENFASIATVCSGFGVCVRSVTFIAIIRFHLPFSIKLFTISDIQIYYNIIIQSFQW